MNKAPRSGWLSKLTTGNAFCASRWQSRYFVLLDSEMRYYKDEHSTNASRTISLREVTNVSLVSLPNRPYCFRLEPVKTVDSKKQQKVWTIACQSEYELESWVSAINCRLTDLLSTEAGLVLSPSVQPFSMPEQKRQQPFFSFTRILTSGAAGQDVLNFVQPRVMKRSNFTISRRRGVILSPLDVETIPSLENDMLSSSSSKNSSPSSPTAGLPGGTLVTQDEEERVIHEGHASKVQVKTAYVLDAASPSFALYKESINLY
ncbi:hypothetical protein EDC96DRAFT_510871 [Choanephora cucurbitarum]|nr:hypothetical protein EDC96DRAFT_510871 [Choanephora cucurbitarum]